jgi:serine-type D-Ala-D-Ala carboxypeptidase (penicillin-binding protein 5/6)
MTSTSVRSAFLLLLATAAPSTAQDPLPPRAPADRSDGPPVVSAKAWVVADGQTGKMLWGFKESEPLPMASTTKIMTARIVLRLAAADGKVLDEVVTYSERAASTTGSSARLKAGEKLAVRELLYGLLLPSGNDAAVALAEHFGPRLRGDGPDGEAVALFIAEMNRQARALKLEETKYLDPNGLARNLTSARDLAALTADVFRDEAFRRYVGTRRYQCEVVGPKGEKRTITWDNTNRLLGIEGYDGVKTGSTTAAGSCLVASGRHETGHLIVVVLGCTSNDSRYVDARNLFRWAWGERRPKTDGR